VTLLDEAHPNEIERSLYEVDHVARAFALIDRGRFDVVHDHCGFTASRWPIASRRRWSTRCTASSPRARRRSTPTTGTRRRWWRSAVRRLNARRRRSSVVAAIPNPIDLSAWSLQERKGDYVLWIGRMTEIKGPHRAIAAARAAGVPLILAGVIQPGQQPFFDREIAPHIDGERVRFVGEVGGGPSTSVRERACAADADPLGGAVRHGHGRGARLRHPGDRVSRGRGP
jgi:glycosyltransferase involved in cell wall biosynthesis